MDPFHIVWNIMYVLLGIGISMTNVLVRTLFATNRGFGGSRSTLGHSTGHLSAPAVVTYLIQKYGWRSSTLIMAAVSAHIIVFGVLYRAGGGDAA